MRLQPSSRHLRFYGALTAAGIVFIALMITAVSCHKKLAHLKQVYSPLYTLNGSQVEWTSLGRYWWSARSQANAARAAYWMGRPLPRWGYVRELRVLEGLVAVHLWDMDDKSSLMVIRRFPGHMPGNRAFAESLRADDMRNRLATWFCRWQGDPPPLWSTLKPHVFASLPTSRPLCQGVQVAFPQMPHASSGELWTVLIGSDTWNVLAFSEHAVSSTRIHQFIDALANPVSLKERLRMYSEVAQVRPLGSGDALELTCLYLAMGRWARAYQTWCRHSVEFEQDFRFYRAYGIEMRQRGLPHWAAVGFDMALALQKKNLFILKNLGDSLLRDKRYQNAVALYQHWVDIEPRSADPWVGLGRAYDEAHQFPQALKALHAALALDKRSAVALQGLGHVLIEQGNDEEGLQLSMAALQIQPQSADAVENVCIVYGKRKEYEKALTPCQQAVRWAPRQASAHAFLGAVLTNLHRLPEALAAFRQADRLTAANSFNLAYESIIYTNLNQPKEAAQALRQAIKLSPSDLKLHSLLAQTYVQLGDKQGVEKEKKVMAALTR